MGDGITARLGFHDGVSLRFDRHASLLTIEPREPLPTVSAFVALRHDTDMMIALAGELRAIADDLAEAAGKDRLDGALAYLGSMLDGMSCEDVMVAAAEAVNAFTDCGSLYPVSPGQLTLSGDEVQA